MCVFPLRIGDSRVQLQPIHESEYKQANDSMIHSKSKLFIGLYVPSSDCHNRSHLILGIEPPTFDLSKIISWLGSSLFSSLEACRFVGCIESWIEQKYDCFLLNIRTFYFSPFYGVKFRRRGQTLRADTLRRFRLVSRTGFEDRRIAWLKNVFVGVAIETVEFLPYSFF